MCKNKTYFVGQTVRIAGNKSQVISFTTYRDSDNVEHQTLTMVDEDGQIWDPMDCAALP